MPGMKNGSRISMVVSSREILLDFAWNTAPRAQGWFALLRSHNAIPRWAVWR